MKKLLALVMAFVMMLSLCACASVKDAVEDILPGTTVQPPQDTEEKPEDAQDDAGDALMRADEPAPDDIPVRGNEPSNLAAGGHVAISKNGQLFWAHVDGSSWGAEPTGEGTGVYARVGDGYEKISDDNAMDLNVVGNTLYYIAQTWNGDEGTSEIVAMNLDGSDRRVIAESLPIKWEMRISDDDNHAEYTHFGGYSDLVAFGDQLYFIADNGKSGGRDIHSNYMDRTYSTIWHNEKSLYRTDLSGENKTVIIESLGNGNAHFTIGHDREIYYTTCYDAGSTVYPHITLNSCKLDGSNAQLLYGTKDTTAQDALHEIVGGLFCAEGYLFVSCSDSEGDFPHGRLMAYKDGQYELWGDETFYVNYAYDGADGLYSLFTETEYVVYNEETGKEYIEGAMLIDMDLSDPAAPVTALHEFGRIDRWEDEFSHFELSVFDDGRLLTLLTDDALYTMDADNGWELTRVVK